ncbi:MAG TPA: hypothetical protein VGI39_11010, partial [Polyangiaceae bacterium]
MIAALGAAACARRAPPPPDTSTPAAPVGSGAAAQAAAPQDASVASAGAWADAVRSERWEEAWRLLEALPAPAQAQPEVRYARASVALARADGKSAIASLEGLEAALPLLADHVEQHRAEAELLVGPYDVAGEWYLARGTPAALVHAAEAFDKAKAPARAKAACDRLLQSDKRTRAQEAEARAIRLRLAPDDAAEADDARWLAVHAPDLSWGKNTEASLARLAVGKPLTTDELLARGEALSLSGRAEEAARTIDRVEHAPGRRVPTLERLRAKGDAFYRGGKYPDAARVLAQCAAAGGPHAGEDAFRAARSL